MDREKSIQAIVALIKAMGIEDEFVQRAIQANKQSWIMTTLPDNIEKRLYNWENKE